LRVRLTPSSSSSRVGTTTTFSVNQLTFRLIIDFLRFTGCMWVIASMTGAISYEGDPPLLKVRVLLRQTSSNMQCGIIATFSVCQWML
jgi:hypothetical protein